MINTFLLFIAFFMASTFRVFVVNLIINIVALKNLSFRKTILLKSCFYSEIAILLSDFLFSLVWGVVFISSSNEENFLLKMIYGIVVGFFMHICLGNYTIGIFFLLFEFIVPFALILLFNNSFVYKEINISNRKKTILVVISSLCSAPYLLFVPLTKISFANDIIGNLISDLI